MSTYKRADKTVTDLASEILCQFESHKPLLDARVKIDYLMAYGDRDDDGNLISNALSKNGRQVLGITRKIPLKERAAGRGDAEIILDGNWWIGTASEDQQRALMDHELHHIALKTNKGGGLITDDLQRPQIKIRKHDYEFGWFRVIADRHAENSIERIQAMQMFDEAGQSFWPTIARLEK